MPRRRLRSDPSQRASTLAAGQPGSGSKNAFGSTLSSSDGNPGSARSAARLAGCSGATNRPSHGASSASAASPTRSRALASAVVNDGSSIASRRLRVSSLT